MHKKYRYIPFILETARLLAALIRPNHLVRLSSWGLTYLPPPCNSNDFGYNLLSVKRNGYAEHTYRCSYVVMKLMMILFISTLTACTEYKASVNQSVVEVSSMPAHEIVIYSPSPSGIMLHAHNVALGDALNNCKLPSPVSVIPMALPDSINHINTLEVSEKPYHLPIVTTLDFQTAIQGNAPDWHGYTSKNPDLKFVSSLYDVSFGLLTMDASIQTVADLAGKRIAVPARPSAVRWFTEVLLRDGWNILDQVTLVDIAPPQVPAAIAKGEIDVVAWNIMSETPEGFQPLLPMLVADQNAHWLDVDMAALDAINAANPFVTAMTRVPSNNIRWIENSSDTVVNLLSFRQALAAWTATPDEIVKQIVQCLATTTLPFSDNTDFAERQFNWPGLKEEDIHPAARAALPDGR